MGFRRFFIFLRNKLGRFKTFLIQIPPSPANLYKTCIDFAILAMLTDEINKRAGRYFICGTAAIRKE